MKSFVLSLLIVAVLCDVCPDTTPANHYPLPDLTYTSGLAQNAIALPTTLSVCELYELQKYCVAAINVFRTGTVKFGDGRSAPFSAKTPLKNPDTPLLQCLNEKAMSDLAFSNKGSGCGHYTSREQCDLGTGGGAENSCCPRSCGTFESCKATLDGCLTQMYDEGEIVLDTGSSAFTNETGHYLSMIGNYRNVVCGFGFDNQGGMLATQNFFGDGATNKPCTYNCGDAASPDEECGKCFGVSYCSANSDCTSPPTCYTPAGTCTQGVCEYKTLAITCPAGTCTTAGVCEQSCADANCDVCSASGAGSCSTCKAGYDLQAGCCISLSCVTVSGAKYGVLNGQYAEIGKYGGQISYKNTNGAYFLVVYCCGRGWSFTNSATGGSYYQSSSVTDGNAVASSGSWSDSGTPTPGVTIQHCAGCTGEATMPQDCEGTWSICNAACTRTFTETQAKAGAGAECPEKPQCSFGSDACVEAKDCQLSWSACDEDCKRTSSQIQAKQGAGAECPTMPACTQGTDECPATTEKPAMPSDTVLQDRCSDGRILDCNSRCFSPFSLVKNALGNGKCGDFASYGLNLNCDRFFCDLGDCGLDCPKFAASSIAVGEPVPQRAVPVQLVGAVDFTGEATSGGRVTVTVTASYVLLALTLPLSLGFLH